jgi:hypothetical protein
MLVRLLIASFFLSVAALPASATSQAIKDLVANCKADAGKFCSSVIPGGGRIAECLKAHKDEISANCVDALLKAKAEAEAGGGK